MVGHSDADVVLPAVADALLGAAAMGDIGELYPDTDPAWKGLDSGRPSRPTSSPWFRRAGWRTVNCDVIVHAQEPKLGPHKRGLPWRTSPRLLGVDQAGGEIVKAKTGEQSSGRSGRGRGDRLRGRRSCWSASRPDRLTRPVAREESPRDTVRCPTGTEARRRSCRSEFDNTLTQTKEPFQTVTPGKVGMYVCGPTVYSGAMIGHMVGPVIFDTIKRYLVYLGYEVTWVVNITDVDDKLIVQAQKDGTSVKERWPSG